MKTTFLLWSLAATYVLWIFYLASMALIRAKEAGTLPKASLVLGYPVVIFGVVLDWLVNVVVMTVYFMDIPASPWELVTGRLKRYAYSGKKGKRAAVAKWFGVNLLDPFDPSGKHI